MLKLTLCQLATNPGHDFEDGLPAVTNTQRKVVVRPHKAGESSYVTKARKWWFKSRIAGQGFR